jgi:flagellar basal-body rod modification protein FlgD
MIDAITSTQTTAEPDTGLPITKSQEQKSQFLQLLVAQLKGQDPLNPMDGTQFVAQLAQFSSLEELINIREVMENVNTTLLFQGEAGNPETVPLPF